MIAALIVAGGLGHRFGSPLPKQFWLLNNRPVIMYSVWAFQVNPLVDQIYVVVHRDHISGFKDMVDHRITKLKGVTEGGRTRQESVYRGLNLIEPSCKFVLIHDAARPLLSQVLIEKVLKNTMEKGACIPVLPVRDTIKKGSKEGLIWETLERESLFLVQTPQGFSYPQILEAHKRAIQEGVYDAPDDAYLLERIGKEVYWTEGDPFNLKITYPEDIEYMEYLIEVKGSEDHQDRDPQK